MFKNFSGRNLLAFSAGVDSTFLFFKLIENNIDFDLVMVDYNLRNQSKEEVAWAKELCKKFNKTLYFKEFNEKRFSEKIARDFRYDFFNDICKKYKYDNLLTAHQLNDQMEWVLMQISKGCGLVEMLSMEEKRLENGIYYIKPILEYSRDEILDYLVKHNYKFFIDETNLKNDYKRNKFRNNFCNEFVKEYSTGIKKSFEYLKQDKNILFNDDFKKEIIFDLTIFEITNLTENTVIRIIDRELKNRGVLISSSTRNEILKQKNIIVGEFVVCFNDSKLYICPNIRNKMEKEFKEKCRVNQIPSKVRPYLYSLYLNGDFCL